MLVAVGVGYLVLPVDDGRISQASCDSIQLGWTGNLVLAMLGDKTDVRVSVDVVDEINEVYIGKLTDYLENQIIVRLEGKKGERRAPKVTDRKFVPSQLPIAERMKRRSKRLIRAIWP